MFVPKSLRKFPHVKRHNWLNHQLIIEFLQECSADHSCGTLVDIGCGVKPYKEIFAPFVEQHIGVDLDDGIHGKDSVDVVGTAYKTSLSQASCDTILCSEVLEHLEDPQRAIREMNRILVDGGKVVLTVPFFWPVHEAPRDFFRYTNFGLAYLFESNSFDILEIRPLTGFWAMEIQMLIYGTLSWKRRRLLSPFVTVTHHLLQHLALLLNRYDKKTEFTNLYGVVAIKKASL